jgi:hypothetical protein
LKPRSEGLAANKPFSTASVALKDNVIMELTMSSIRACKAVSNGTTNIYRCVLTAGRYAKCSVSNVTSELAGALIVFRVGV